MHKFNRIRQVVPMCPPMQPYVKLIWPLVLLHFTVFRVCRLLYVYGSFSCTYLLHYAFEETIYVVYTFSMHNVSRGNNRFPSHRLNLARCFDFARC